MREALKVCPSKDFNHKHSLDEISRKIALRPSNACVVKSYYRRIPENDDRQTLCYLTCPSPPTLHVFIPLTLPWASRWYNHLRLTGTWKSYLRSERTSLCKYIYEVMK